jgi:hypothetical protein
LSPAQRAKIPRRLAQDITSSHTPLLMCSKNLRLLQETAETRTDEGKAFCGSAGRQYDVLRASAALALQETRNTPRFADCWRIRHRPLSLQHRISHVLFFLSSHTRQLRRICARYGVLRPFFGNLGHCQKEEASRAARAPPLLLFLTSFFGQAD